MESFTPALKWLNLILTYIYAGLTMACFIMALGNRPKGSKWGYSTAFITFAISASASPARPCAPPALARGVSSLTALPPLPQSRST